MTAIKSAPIVPSQEPPAPDWPQEQMEPRTGRHKSRGCGGPTDVNGHFPSSALEAPASTPRSALPLDMALYADLALQDSVKEQLFR